MANYTDTEKQYNQIISSAITGFDNIFDALKAKSTKDTAGEALKSDTTGVPVSDYPTIISSQLFRVGDRGEKNGGAEPVNTAGVISDFGGKELSATSFRIAYGADGGSATITLKPASAGYVDTATTINSGSISGVKNVTISGTLSTTPASGAGYTYKAAENEGELGTFVVDAGDGLLKSVSIQEGKAEITGSASVAHAAGAKIDVATTGSDLDPHIILDTLGADQKAEDYRTIKLSSTSDIKENVTATLTKSVIAGYINDVILKAAAGSTIEDGNITVPEQTLAPVSKATTIYIPKGKITNVQATGGSLTNTGDTDIIAADDAANAYSITTTLGGLTISGDISAGYVDNGKLPTGNIDAVSKTIKIAKGSIADATTNVTLKAELSSSAVEILDAKPADGFTISVKNNGASNTIESTLKFAAGYIATATPKDTITINQKDIHLAKGSAAVTSSLTGVEYTEDLTGLVLTAKPETAGTYYTVTPKISTSVAYDAANSHKGYLVPDTTTIGGTGLTKEAANPFYIAKGHIAFDHQLTVTKPEGSSFSLSTSAPSGKYFKFETTGTTTVTPGYVRAIGDVTESDKVAYYMPEAKFEYVQASSGKNFIQVKTAGYVESGSIGAVEGTIDYAEVKGTLTSDVISSLASGSVSASDYAITISKASTTDAGYISGKEEEGSLALDKTYYIKHGSATLSPAITGIAFSKVTKNAKSGKYNVTATASGSVETRTLVEGYIKTADLTVNEIAEKADTLELEQAVLTVETGEAALETTPTGVKPATGTSRFYVTPKIAGKGNISINAAVTSAGYVDTSVTSTPGSISVSADKATPFYILEGTTKAATLAEKTLAASEITNNFAGSQTGDYTITINGTSAGSVDVAEGYYGPSSTISTTQTVTGSTKVAHGSATVGVSADITYTNGLPLKISNVGEAAEADYYKITGAITNVSKTGTAVTKEGYMKEADIAVSATATTSTNAVFIKKYSKGKDKPVSGDIPTTTVDKTTYYVPAAVANLTDDAIIHTENTYVDHDIKVILGENAIGTKPAADLERLKQRLAGTLVKGAA